MTQVVIEKPVLNSPFEDPQRHFRFDDEGITNEIVEKRRISSYFIPIPRAKKKGKQTQLSFESQWTQDRVKENEFINKVRARVPNGGWVGILALPTPLRGFWITGNVGTGS